MDPSSSIFLYSSTESRICACRDEVLHATVILKYLKSLWSFSHYSMSLSETTGNECLQMKIRQKVLIKILSTNSHKHKDALGQATDNYTFGNHVNAHFMFLRFHSMASIKKKEKRKKKPTCLLPLLAATACKFRTIVKMCREVRRNCLVSGWHDWWSPAWDSRRRLKDEVGFWRL